MLVQEMAICIARDVYVCGIHSPTWALRADDPSRGKPLTPLRAPVPAWILLLRSGHKAQAQDVLDQSSGTSRALGRWYLFCAVACLAASADLSSFSEWAAAFRSAPRPGRLGARPGYGSDCKSSGPTAHKICGMAQPGRTSVDRFASCCASQPCPACRTAGRIWQGDVRTQGSSRRNFAETINSIQQRFPFLKTLLVGPWQRCTTWENICPGTLTLHPPIPFPLLKAMVSVALSWEWTRLSLLLLVGFFALLRPAEMLHLRAKDFILSLDSGLPHVVILQLHMVKSRTRGAKFQSVRLDEEFVIAFLKRKLKVMMPSERIWPHSPHLFRTRFYQVVTAACGVQKIVYPSSLRPGGATFLFQRWEENLVKLQWRGRWMHTKTMLHYIQELGAINVMQRFSPAQRCKIYALAKLCEEALMEVEVQVDWPTLLLRFKP